MKNPRLGVFKFASCDGCQVSILNLEEDFFRLLEVFTIDYFREATDKPLSDYFDLALVEGSISNLDQKEHIIEIRERSRYLYTIGACATSGGVQAIRNWATLESYKSIVYPEPRMIESLASSTPISDHVYVDYEIWGCPINSNVLSEVLASFLIGTRPTVPRYSLCMECKINGIPCVLVARNEPCLGPVTRAGCNALCPSFNRACYGCFGPRDGANINSLIEWLESKGFSHKETKQFLDRMNTYAYRRARIEKKD